VRTTLTEISVFGSSAAAPFGAFLFWHIPGQRGKKSVVSGQLSVLTGQFILSS
jgi:hypothetical protein